MQLLTIVSLQVVEKAQAEMTEFHVVVRVGDGPPFRLRTVQSRPIRLMHFGTGHAARSRQFVEDIFLEGGHISAKLENVGQPWQNEADGFRPGDKAVDPKLIVVAERVPQALVELRKQAVHTAPVPGDILFNAGDKMGTRSVSEVLRRGTG